MYAPPLQSVSKRSRGHHGGAWKIAYTDFVSAMMAFFLLMWLLGSTSSGYLKSIADYFLNPLKVDMSGGTGAGDATSILKSAGKDLTRTEGQVKDGEMEAKKKTLNLKQAKADQLRKEFEQREKASLRERKNIIEKLIDSNSILRQFKNQLLIDVTPDGLCIQIIDEKNRPMFDSSSSELKPYFA